MFVPIRDQLIKLGCQAFSNNPYSSLHLKYHACANDLDGLTILILQDLYTAALLGNCQKQCQFMMHLSQETYLRCRH